MEGDREQRVNRLARQWADVCYAIGSCDDGSGINRGWLVLEAMYRHPPRGYHNLGHIADCLSVCDEVASVLPPGTKPLIEFAIFAHDCVYDSRRSDNEERSAGVAAMLGREASLAGSAIEAIVRLVLATTHRGMPHDASERFIRDIDLSSLAADPDAFDANTRGIRAEYAWATDEKWRAGRVAFFRDMLARPAIYFTPEFRDRFEAKARANMERGLAAMGG